MMKKEIFLAVICILAAEKIDGQNEEFEKLHPQFEFGVIIEMADLISSWTITDYNIAEINNKKSTKAMFTPITVYLSPKLNFNEKFCFEVRPGFFWGGEPFTGFEYGFYFRYKLIESGIILISGINFHSNMGTAHNSGFSTGETITEYNFSLGYKLNKTTNILLSFYKPSEHIEFYGKTNDYGNWESYKLKYIVKFGFEFQF